MSEYQIIRVHNDPVKPGGGVAGLEAAVATACAEGWRPAGGPFFEPGLMLWCQAMTRDRGAQVAGEVPIRGAELPQLPVGLVHVGADPKDGPLRMREPKPKP